jgi:hypothetical protein
MRHEFDEEFGKVEFSLLHRERVILMSFPIGENVLFVLYERQIDREGRLVGDYPSDIISKSFLRLPSAEKRLLVISLFFVYHRMKYFVCLSKNYRLTTMNLRSDYTKSECMSI